MATDPRVHLYEGLFLLNQQAVAADYTGCIQFLRDVFARAEAELIVLRKWEERKLAFEIKGQKRGIYLLAYFRVRGAQIANIERDCSLSDHILRSMIIRADHLGEVELELAKKDADLSLELKLRSEDRPRRDDAAPVAAPVAEEPAASTEA
ncbi:MAG: 30S ribosomal protein S6 [Planctomycetes bacterium]|nr:30S ribosomal protein S6 [Planctomycetota bacterium]